MLLQKSVYKAFLSVFYSPCIPRYYRLVKKRNALVTLMIFVLLLSLLTGCSQDANQVPKLYAGVPVDSRNNGLQKNWEDMTEEEKKNVPGFTESMSDYEGITSITDFVTWNLEMGNLAELFDKTLKHSQIAIDLAVVGTPKTQGGAGDYEISNDELLQILRKDYETFYNLEEVDENGKRHVWREYYSEVKEFLAGERDGFGPILNSNIKDFERWDYLSELDVIYLQILEAYENAIAFVEKNPTIYDRTNLYINDDNPLLKARDIFQRYHFYLFGGKIESDEFKRYDFKKADEEASKKAG